MEGEKWVQSQSLNGHGSESKVSVRQKRGAAEVEEMSESSQKRVKMRDLDSVFRSDAEAERGGSNTVHADVYSDSRPLDLNVNAGSMNVLVGDDTPACINESKNVPAAQKEGVRGNDDLAKAKGLNLDLNVEDISSSINDPFYPYKNYEHQKSRDDSECGSSVGPLDEKHSMRVWKGLKQNNYMSAPHGAVPMPMPKPRGRKKSNNDAMKRKIELANKEQVDRFARIAAPSGLLNGLNPGIINHVRNSKQVHSIIEALVRSERTERKEQEDVQGSEVNTRGFSHEDALPRRKQMNEYTLFSKLVYTNEVARVDGESQKGQTRTFSRMPSHCNMENKDDNLALKLSSSVTVASENTSSLSNDESANHSSVTSLSIKAANVASQWLELLNQDIKGRLAALRRSKKRVRAVITTELPLLMSKELSNLGKDLSETKGYTVGHLDQATANAHSVRWNTLFTQMDKTLAEEESHLESWLNQVKEMQLHCEKGLFKNASHQTGPQGTKNRSGAADNAEQELAVRAAAASIYSTCNFLLSTENLPCC